MPICVPYGGSGSGGAGAAASSLVLLAAPLDPDVNGPKTTAFVLPLQAHNKSSAATTLAGRTDFIALLYRSPSSSKPIYSHRARRCDLADGRCKQLSISYGVV
jgi:hypothetical protein